MPFDLGLRARITYLLVFMAVTGVSVLLGAPAAHAQRKVDVLFGENGLFRQCDVPGDRQMWPGSAIVLSDVASS